MKIVLFGGNFVHHWQVSNRIYWWILLEIGFPFQSFVYNFLFWEFHRLLPFFNEYTKYIDQEFQDRIINLNIFIFCFSRFGSVCPQRLPDISNETAALDKMPKGRLEYLRRLFPYLQNQSEDCLYLNIYAPIQGEFWLCL